MLKAIAAVSAELLNFIEALQLSFSKSAISSPLGDVTRVVWASNYVIVAIKQALQRGLSALIVLKAQDSKKGETTVYIDDFDRGKLRPHPWPFPLKGEG